MLPHEVDYGNRICHRNERLLKQHYCSDGYLSVKLKDNKNHRVHRLVASAFYGDNPTKEVDHINGIRDDNRVENLRWVTHRENVIHTYELGNGQMTGKFNSLNNNAKSVELSNDNVNLKFGSMKECCEFIYSTQDTTIAVRSMYQKIKHCYQNNKPFYGYSVSM